MKNESKEIELIKKLKQQKISAVDIAHFLKNNEVEINKLDKNGYNILHYAIKTDSPEIVNLVLNPFEESKNKPADPNIKTEDEGKNVFLPPMLFALIHTNDDSTNFKTIKLLLKAGADHKLSDESGCNILHRAAEKGRRDIIDLILASDQASDLNGVSKFGAPIHLAITTEQDEIVQFLLEKKVDLKVRDKDGNTALHLSVKLKHFNLFKLLFDYVVKSFELANDDKKAILNAINEEGNTILHEFAMKKSLSLIDRIKEIDPSFKIDEKIKNKEGFTYMEAFEEILDSERKKEEYEKQKKNLIRKEKERAQEEKLKEAEEIKKERELQQKERERQEKIGLIMLKYRGVIFGLVAVAVCFMIYLLVLNASHKKEKII